MNVTLAELPYWARVAFGARCARSVLPLFRSAWPDALPRHLSGLETCVRLAEESAANGVAAAGLIDAVVAAVSTAGASLTPALGTLPGAEPGPIGETACRVSYSAARAAANAVQSVIDGPEGSLKTVSDALTSALQAAESAESPAIVSALKQDLEIIGRLAKQKRWTDAAPVAPAAFEPIVEKAAGRPWWKFW